MMSPSLVLLLLEGEQEVVKQLVPEVGLIQVGGVTCPRQHLGLGGAGEQRQIIPRPEYGEIYTLVYLDNRSPVSQASVPFPVHDHGGQPEVGEHSPALGGGDRCHRYPGPQRGSSLVPDKCHKHHPMFW